MSVPSVDRRNPASAKGWLKWWDKPPFSVQDFATIHRTISFKTRTWMGNEIANRSTIDIPVSKLLRWESARPAWSVAGCQGGSAGTLDLVYIYLSTFMKMVGKRKHINHHQSLFELPPMLALNINTHLLISSMKNHVKSRNLGQLNPPPGFVAQFLAKASPKMCFSLLVAFEFLIKIRH